MVQRKKEKEILKKCSSFNSSVAWLFESTAIAKNIVFTVRQLFSNKLNIINAKTIENQLVIEDNPDISYKNSFLK